MDLNKHDSKYFHLCQITMHSVPIFFGDKTKRRINPRKIPTITNIPKKQNVNNRTKQRLIHPVSLHTIFCPQIECEREICCCLRQRRLSRRQLLMRLSRPEPTLIMIQQSARHTSLSSQRPEGIQLLADKTSCSLSKKRYLSPHQPFVYLS